MFKMCPNHRVQLTSASPTNTKTEKATKGLNLEIQGRKLKNKISRKAVEQTTKIYQAVLNSKRKK